MEKTVVSFFNERKDDQIKSKTKAGMSDEEKAEIQRQVEDRFDLENWLPDAAKRAGQISLSTHPCTYSHPSSAKNKNGKTISILVNADDRNDGYLRSGNVNVEIDAYGNAAALDVYKFLTLQMEGGQFLIDHLEQNTEVAKQVFNIQSTSYEDLRDGFLAMKTGNSTSITSSKIKQVYFPVEDDYHLLSVFSPSGMMYEMRDRIQKMRFGESAKQSRERRKKGEHCETGFDDLYNLSMIGFGGTKPQNISVLNNRYGGKAYLLPSIPPELKKGNIRLPKRSFFSECLWFGEFKESYSTIHKLLIAPPNNVHIRKGVNNTFMYIFDQIIKKVWKLRGENAGWSDRESFTLLPQYQKHILDPLYRDQLDSLSESSEKFLKEISSWILDGYDHVLGTQKKLLGDDRIKEIQRMVIKQREALL